MYNCDSDTVMSEKQILKTTLLLTFLLYTSNLANKNHHDQEYKENKHDILTRFSEENAVLTRILGKNIIESKFKLGSVK